MKKLPFLLASVVLFASCAKKDTTVNQLAERIIMDTAYANVSGKQKMDIYLPANRDKNTRTIILIHGGGWSEGSKTDLTEAVPLLRKQFPNYAFANINYRLAAEGNNLFPTQEIDVKSAVRFITDNGSTFNISSKVVLAGFSAGAHLALLHGYKNDPDEHVAGIVDFFGPTDLPGLFQIGVVQALTLTNATGKIYPDGKSIYEDSSPTQFVSAQSPPTLILHGTNDPLVPPSQSLLLESKLNEFNIWNKIEWYEGEAHGWQGSKLDDSIQKVKAFIENNTR